jgi:hypothetical protein
VSSLEDSKRVDISPPENYYEMSDDDKNAWCLAVANIIHEKLLADKQ